MADQKSNPIEEAIGERAKDPKAQEKYTKEVLAEPIPLNNSLPSDVPDEPTPNEMLALEELNRQTEERFRDVDNMEELAQQAPAKTTPVSQPVPQPETENCSPESPPQILEIFVDGAVRDNYQKAAVGCVIKADGKTLKTISKEIGPATNNEAEYKAIHAGLEAGLKMNADSFILYSDSELAVRQLNGEYEVKKSSLADLHATAKTMLIALNCEIVHIPREKNKEADVLANNAFAQTDSQPTDAFDSMPIAKGFLGDTPPDDHQKHVEAFEKTMEKLSSPAEDIELTALRKYVFGDSFVVSTVAYHIVSLCAQPMVTPTTTTWAFKDRALIPNMVFSLLRQPGYLEGIWPSLKIIMSSNVGNESWCAGIATTIAFFDVIRTLPTLKEMDSEEKS